MMLVQNGDHLKKNYSLKYGPVGPILQIKNNKIGEKIGDRIGNRIGDRIGHYSVKTE